LWQDSVIVVIDATPATVELVMAELLQNPEKYGEPKDSDIA